MRVRKAAGLDLGRSSLLFSARAPCGWWPMGVTSLQEILALATGD